MKNLSFFLFVVCTGVLFVRPTELVDFLSDAPLYEISILGCLLISLPQLVGQVSPGSLRRNPITFCVVGLLCAVPLSFLGRFALGEAATAAFTFFKAVLSFLLLIAVIDTTTKLRQYVAWMFGFILLLTNLALLQHYGVIDNPALAAAREPVVDRETGEIVDYDLRLSGAGIFANPNDLSRIVVVGIALSLYFLGSAPAMGKLLCVGTLGIFGHALILTQSRGGLSALLATLLVLAYTRFGAKRTFAFAVCLLPLFIAIGDAGRQTDFTASEGTGQQRIQLWSDGLEALRSSPLFGIGMGNYDEITGGLGAHNSFVHAYVELGFIGGALFFGTVLWPIWACQQLARHRHATDPDLRRLGSYLFAILVGYATGMLTSSRCYMIPTYILVGLVVAYLRLARCAVILPSFRVNARFVALLTVANLFFLVAIQGYVLSTIRFGSQ